MKDKDFWKAKINKKSDNLEIIGKELKNIRIELSRLCSIEQDKKQESVMHGLSTICRNVYAENIRMDEIIKLLKELFHDKNVKIEGELDAKST